MQDYDCSQNKGYILWPDIYQMQGVNFVCVLLHTHSIELRVYQIKRYNHKSSLKFHQVSDRSFCSIFQEHIYLK